MRMGMKWLSLAVAVAVVISTSSAMAQRGQGQGRGGQGRGGFGGGFGFGGGGAAGLLAMQQIQKELDLSDDQKEAIQKVFEESRQQQGERPNFQNLSDEERQKLFTEMREKAEARAKETQKKIDDILLPNQRERLAELRIQSQARFGIATALASPEVAEKLKLTDEQKEKLEALAPRFGGFGRGGQGGQRGARGEGNNQDAPRLSREERDAKAKEILTADQAAQFEKLQGKKFEFPEMGRGGRGGRGGEGGGERGRRRGQPDA